MLERSPNIKQRALFVTSSPALRWNRMSLAELKEEKPPAAIVLATKQSGRFESATHPLYYSDCRQCDWYQTHLCSACLHHSGVSRDFGCPSRRQRTQRVVKCVADPAWVRGWQIATSKGSVPPGLPSARISSLSLYVPNGRSSGTGWRAALAQSFTKSRT